MGKPIDIVQGTLDLLILKVLSLESKHGWAIAKRIQQISNEELQVPQGSLYPALYRLEHQGWIASRWRETETGRSAKFYTLTAAGRKRLEAELANWSRLSNAINLVVRTTEPTNMRWIQRLTTGTRAILRRRRVEQELDVELQFHLDQQIEENLAAGMTPHDARAAARRQLGSLTLVHERCRESLGVRLLDELWQDTRYGLRALRRSPGFSAASIISMALGIGVNTTLFSVADGVLLKPLPYPHADRLVRLSEYRPGGRSAVIDPMLSNFTFEVWRRNTHALDALAPYSGRAYTVTGAGDAAYVAAATVSPDVFRMLDVSPVVGRFFTASEAAGGADHVAVLGYEFWKQRFGGSSAAIGTSINLDAQPYVIVGVTPAGFSFPDPGVSLYTPFVTPAVRTGAGQPNFRLMWVLGRLAPGATVAQAEAEGTAVARGQGALPVAADIVLGKGGPDSVRVRTLIDNMTATVRPVLMLLGGGAVLVLLVGCANVANLFLARGVARGRELVVRAALGAGRARLARQLMTETLLIAGAGGILGGLGARWLVGLWPTLAPRTFPRTGDVRFDTGAALFTVVATVLAGFFVGSVSAFQKAVPLATLGAGARVSGGVKTARARRAFIAGQTACAAVLLILSALLIRSFIQLVKRDPGYDASHVITARITLQGSPAPPTLPTAQTLRWQHVADAVLDRVRAMPDVESAGAATMAPFGDVTNMIGFYLRPDGPDPILAHGVGYVVTSGYAEALHLHLREGRLLRDSDSTSGIRAMVVNERFASLYLHDGHPVVGRRYANLMGRNVTGEIVGIVGNVLKNGFLDTPQPEFYLAAGNEGVVTVGQEINLVVRTSAAPSEVAANLRSIVRDVDPRDAPVHNIALLTTLLSATAGESRFASTMFGAFAALALCLAAVGLYGVLSYGVSQRRRELGVRTALGATRRNVLVLVMREGMGLTALGLILGIAVAAVSARLLGTLLFDISALDGASFAAGPLILVVVALIACVLPAWRASSLNPLEALRSE